jgi:hypothetical protein
VWSTSIGFQDEVDDKAKWAFLANNPGRLL